MRKFFVLSIALAVGVVLLGAPGGLAQSERPVYLLKAEGPVTPAMAEYLERGLQQAQSAGAEAVVFQLDTPGGAIDTMNRMVQAIRGSSVPVIVYVAPRGAIAGSAGTVITLAGHAAAMAPETAIGAASPVGGQGEDLGETVQEKAKEILKATVRSLASRRGEEAVELAEATIEEARAASAEEALEVGLIDYIADDLQDLLRQADGATLEVGGRQRTIMTADAPVVEVEQSLIERLLQALTNPNIVFLLLAIGVQSLLIELSNPGGWIAGFIGVVSLALAGYGLGVLPVNWFGLIFVATAFVLFLMEINAATHGVLAAAGLGSLIIGALVLFNSPNTPGFMRVSIPAVLSIALLTGGTFLFIVTFALRAQRQPVTTGAEGLIGRTAIVRSRLAPQGTVHVAGELWSAQLAEGSDPQERGEEVEIVGVERLRLLVKPVARPSG